MLLNDLFLTFIHSPHVLFSFSFVVMNCRLVVLALAVFTVGVIAVSEADMALIEQWAETAAETRPQLDALPNNGKIMRFQERPTAVLPVQATYSKRTSRRAQGAPGTIDGLHTALIHDPYIRDGDEAKEAQRHLRTLKLEPPAAMLPPIVGDVDQKIIDMAYDLSFKARPLKKGKKPADKRGKELLKTLKELKNELKTVDLKDKKKKKKANKGKGKGKGKGKAKAKADKKKQQEQSAQDAENKAAEEAEAEKGGELADAAAKEAKGF